jgi:hypothetical protein
MEESLVKYWTRGMRSDKPAAGSVCQTDKGRIRFQWKCVNAHGKVRLNRVFFENNYFKQELTCQNSGPAAASKFPQVSGREKITAVRSANLTVLEGGCELPGFFEENSHQAPRRTLMGVLIQQFLYLQFKQYTNHRIRKIQTCMDLFLIPLQLVIIGLFVYRNQVISKFPRQISEILTHFVTNMRLELGKKIYTIIVPIGISIGLYLIWVFYNLHFFNTFPLISITDPLFGIDSIILAPITEQILQCSLLTAFYFMFSRIYKNQWVIRIMCFGALLISAYLMAEAHLNPSPINWLLRFFLFVVYGGLYFLNGRNLLPSIIAHATWNIVLLNPISF